MSIRVSLSLLCRLSALSLSLCATGARAVPASAYPFEADRQTASRAPSASDELQNPFATNETALPQFLAHAILVKANPEKEAVVTDVPEEIVLIFNDGVGEEYLALAVVDESGKRVDKHDAKLDFTDHSHLRASVEKLPPGRYMVRYRVLSADGHVVSGKYYFQVQGKQ